MNDQEMKKAVKQAVDHRLSGLDENPFLAQRIIASEKGIQPMKKYKLSLALLMALILILSMLTVALAAEYLHRSVNWFGKSIHDEYNTSVNPTPTPQPIVGAQDPETVFMITQQVFDTAADRELILVVENGTDSMISGSSNSQMVSIHSMDELEAILNNADYIPLANYIPDGYEFVEGTVYYSCKPDGEYILDSKEEIAEGIVVQRYHVDEEDSFIKGYSVVLRNSPEDYHYLSIFVSLEPSFDLNEYSFGVNEDQDFQVVSVNGYDNALCITSDQTCRLSMRKGLKSPIDFLAFAPLSTHYLDTYVEVHVDVSAPQLNVETLIDMFAEKQSF